MPQRARPRTPDEDSPTGPPVHQSAPPAARVRGASNQLAHPGSEISRRNSRGSRHTSRSDPAT
ncbi:hypothetical protein BGZ74_010703, partial [Mortierella antarctica]